MGTRFWVETLGCPKNQVDTDKLVGVLEAEGHTAADDPADADLVVVNTCAFVEEARQESIDTILAFSDRRAPGAKLVVTGCLAERYREELAEALPEVDLVAPFGVPVTIGRKGGPSVPAVPSLDLLELPRPPATAPWAYVKVAEGCDRACGFCAIPSFRGPQRSRRPESILDEVGDLQAREIVLVAQDLARYGLDQGQGAKALVPLVAEVAARVDRVRLLYLYPSDLDDALIDAVLATSVPYFDLSLQHVSRPLLRRMRRWGDDERFRATIASIREREPAATFRSNFIVGYPGETEEDHDRLLAFVEDVRLDWCGFFSFSEEDGTLAATQDGAVRPELMAERLRELSELQDRITAERRADLVGSRVEVLVDEAGVGRTYREAPEIDGVVLVADDLAVGEFATVEISASLGPDLVAT
jgi:ribosomal protein S12 methylthiotransferase